MAVYLINIALLLIFGYFLIYNAPSSDKKKWYCAIASFNWIIISGLRDWHVGADTFEYCLAFQRIRTRSWISIWQRLIEGYNLNNRTQGSILNQEIKDPGYAVFEKLMSMLTENHQVYLIIISVIIFVPLGYFVYKNSEDACFSYILFSTLFYSFYAITGFRQSIATALVVFIGYEFIKQKKWWYFLGIFIVAFTIHKSVIIFLPFYFLSRKKITPQYIIGVIFAVGGVYLLGGAFILELAYILGYDMKDFQMGASTYISLMLILGVAAILLYPRMQKSATNKDAEVNATVLSAGLTILVLLNQGMMRVQQYYALFLMCSIPSMIECFDERSQRILQTLCITILILLLIRNNPQYSFCW